MPEIISKNPVTEAGQKTVSSRSHYSLGAPHFNTYRFGEYGVMDAVEVVPDDRNFQVALRHKLRTYTLGQPLMSRALLKKDCFYVPATCILPFNWDKVYTNPLHGDDVDAGEVGCTVESFQSHVGSFFNYARDIVESFYDSSSGYSVGERLTMLLKFWLGGEMFFSNGCLIHQLGIKLQRLASVIGQPSFSFDQGFDAQIRRIVESVSRFSVVGLSSDPLVVYTSANASDTWPKDEVHCTLREFLCLARDDFDWDITNVVFADGVSVLPDAYLFTVYITGQIDVSLARPASYQIVCAHYFTNDKIDYIFDANLYRQNVYDSLVRISQATGNEFIDDLFTLNGSSFRYDSLSAHFFKEALRAAGDQMSVGDLDTAQGAFFSVLGYLRLLFGFNRSLRYADYFTNAKSQPLAVGDKNVAVNPTGVNVLDMVRGIQVNRFLNAVNRFGRRISEYTKGLFPGVHQSPDFHDPFWLGHTTDEIGAQEIENTSDGQRDANSVTSILRSDAGQYAFETDFEKPGIFISLIYFDIERAYSLGVDRAVQHVDRYDMFNPFLQFTGDQEIRMSELTSSPDGATFGYSLNYIEYKTRVPQVSGGFVENLPGYAFLAEDSRFYQSEDQFAISPSFIRSVQSELDKFYTSLTGYSLGSYFHFQVLLNNSIEVDRPMVYAPSLL